MIELRKNIMSILKEKHNRVYYQRAPNDALFPYVTYNFPNSFKNGRQEVFTLDVDIWDNKDNTIPLETMASDVWKSLDYMRHIDDKTQFTIYQDNRLPPLDEDETNIKRRKLIFQLRYFDKTI